MPKLKTNRGAAKRFKVTKSGKVKKRKRHLRKAKLLDRSDLKQAKRLLPYGSGK
jgi:large subunit ribosomal protein L35